MSELGEITPCYSIRFDRRSKHSPTRLWRAITEPAEVGGWMELPARIDLRVGGDYYVDFPPGKGALDGVIVRVEPERTLAYVWGLSVLEWTITPEEDGCRYSFLHHGQPPGLVPQEGGIAAGWHAWLDNLSAHLDGGPPVDDNARFEDLLPPYTERLSAVLDR